MFAAPAECICRAVPLNRARFPRADPPVDANWDGVLVGSGALREQG